MNVYVLQSRDGAQYVRVFGSMAEFMDRFDRDYRDELSGADRAELDNRYRTAAWQAQDTPGVPADLGDGDTLTFVEVQG